MFDKAFLKSVLAAVVAGVIITAYNNRKTTETESA